MSRLRWLLSLLCLLALTTTALAQTTSAPALLSFQGRIARPDGTPVPDGTYSIRFSLWTAALNGSEKWNQTLDSVAVKNGAFGVLLNLTSGFTAGNDLRTALNGDTYLEIKIGTNAPLTPRQQIVSTAYALRANSVPDGAIGTAQLAENAVTSAKILDNTVASGDLLSDALSLSKVSGGALSLNNNRLFVSNGVIQKGGSAVTGTTDLGLYSQTSGGGMRFVTTNGPFRWYADGGAGTTPLLSLQNGGNLGLGVNAPGTKLDVAGKGRFNTTTGNTGDLNIGASGLYVYNSPTRMLSLYTTGIYNDLKSEGAPLTINHDTGQNLLLNVGGGNVGIGLTNPNARLEIQTGGGVTPSLKLKHSHSDLIVRPFAAGSPDVMLENTTGSMNLNAANLYLNANDSIHLNTSEIHLNASNLHLNASDSIRLETRTSVLGSPRENAGLTVRDNGLEFAADIVGKIVADNYFYHSDVRLKKNIQALPNALDTILSLRGISYQWDPAAFQDRKVSDTRKLGFLAQEVEKVLPELVFTGANGYKSVDYVSLVPVLTEAMKIQQKQIEAKEQRLRTLETENAQLKAAMESVLKRIEAVESNPK
jgi:hypothetical protein